MIKLMLTIAYAVYDLVALVVAKVPTPSDIPMLLGAIKRMTAQAREPERPVRHSAEPQNYRNDRAFSCGPIEVGWQGAH